MNAANVVLTATDPARNVVRIAFVGAIGAEECRRDEPSVLGALATARPGFRLLTDLSRLQSMDVACAPFLAGIMEGARNRQVAQVVRLIPDRKKDIGLSILSLFHYPRGLLILTCETEAEVKRALG